MGDKAGDKAGDKKLNNSQIKVLVEIRNNPNITKPQLTIICNLGKTTIDNNISKSKEYQAFCFLWTKTTFYTNCFFCREMVELLKEINTKTRQHINFHFNRITTRSL